jgi:hypothetical protein
LQRFAALRVRDIQHLLELWPRRRYPHQREDRMKMLSERRMTDTPPYPPSR